MKIFTISKLLALGLIGITLSVALPNSVMAAGDAPAPAPKAEAHTEHAAGHQAAPAAGDQQLELRGNWHPPAPNAANASNAAGAGALKFTKTDIDFGTVEEGKKVELEFPFVNTSNKTITINKVRPSCGCTTAELKKTTFAPGEGDTIKTIFNSTNRTGTQHKAITVETDDPDTPTYRLQFEGDVVSQVYLTDRILQFGDLKQGESKTLEVALINVTGKDVKVLTTQSTAGALKVEVKDAEDFTEPSTNRVGKRIPIEVTVPADYPVGRLSANLSIQTDYTARPNFILVLNGIIRGELSVEPERLYFGILSPKSTAERDTKLIVAEGKSFTMTKFEIDNVANTGVAGEKPSTPEVKVEIKSVEGQKEPEVHVAFTAPETPGRYMGNIVLEGKIGDEAKSMTIPYNAYVRAMPMPQTAAQPANLVGHQ